MILINESADRQERMKYRMKRKKAAAILMAGIMMFSFVGCGSTTKEGKSDSAITGKVTEINDTSVTIQLGQLMQRGAPNGEKPEGEVTDGEKTEKPEGEAPDGEKTEKPEGQAPDDGNQSQGGSIPFEASDETKTIDLKGAEIAEESGRETEEADFEDIEVDDILVIQLGEDGNPESVTIKGGRMEKPEDTDDPGEASSEL